MTNLYCWTIPVFNIENLDFFPKPIASVLIADIVLKILAADWLNWMLL